MLKSISKLIHGLLGGIFTISNAHSQSLMLYICYIYSDIEVNLCLKTLVTHLALGLVARVCVILM